MRSVSLCPTSFELTVLFQDYNYRDYALRRARTGFEQARLHTAEEAVEAFAKGQQQLEVVRRQATISRLYPHQVGDVAFE